MASYKGIVCVTGATSGIGKAVARRFLKDGWKVVAIGRRRERLDELMKEYDDAVLSLPLDVSDRKAVEAAFASLPAGFKPIDVLVNSAGGALGADAAQDASVDNWEGMINVNINGLLYCTKSVISDMAASGKGHIVNIGSVAAFNAYKGANVYGGTKAFVEQFSRNLRCDMHGTGVRVTNIEPGLLESEFSLVRLKDEAKAAAVYADCEPLVPDDIADLVSYVVNTPAHVNVNQVEIMPVCQSSAGALIYRKPKQ